MAYPSSHVKHGVIRAQARLNVAQRLPPCDLREGHCLKQAGAIQGAHTVIPAMVFDDVTKGLPQHVLHGFRKQLLARICAPSQVG